MEKLKFYQITTFALLLLNAALIAFVFLGPLKHKRNVARKGIKAKAVRDLNLSDAQHEQFLDIVRPHIKSIRQLERQQKAVLQPYFLSLLEDYGVEENLDSLLVEVQKIERQKIETTYAHFEKVKSILNPEQQSKFPAFMRKSLRYILANEAVKDRIHSRRNNE